ncbi:MULTISPECIES: ankyrin repeat domain-containing protein [unclassified Wolbachia]|uniref:Jg19758 protein n=1 Tax=Pararge aegeria aegeria TaxID=348720 RepID=A0A8S4QVQ1_9NEOP|nr:MULTISPECIES: ankyrin repeat domain-containing protein [unclassified Wolbachia]CAH2217146.1 jg19758 [Pararge aegeria aegeria]
MNTLLEIVCRKGIRHNEKITELKEFLNKNIKIPIDKELFKSALSIEDAVDIRKDMVYLILHYCIEHDSAISEKKEKLSFQDVMKILDETVNRFITPQYFYFYKLINFQDQSSKNTLLHQAVISNNTEAIEALLKHGANSLIRNKEDKMPLDLAQEEKTREALIKYMQDQAKSKKESARCNSLIGIIPGVFLGIGLGVGSALVPSMTIILCTLAVSALVAGIAVGVAIYFLSQDYKQAKSIEEAVNPQLSSVKYEKTVDNKAVLG